MLKAVIFDMDGVLIDSTSSSHQARTHLLAKHDIDINDLPDPEGEQFRGYAWRKLLAVVHERYDVDFDDEAFIKEARDLAHKDMLTRGLIVDPELVRFLEELKAHKIMIAIASSGQVHAKLDLLKIGHYFELVVNADDVRQHKPHPEPYIQVLKRLGITANECVVFEDSLTGVKAATAAGCRVVGFTGFKSRKTPVPGTIASIDSWAGMPYRTLRFLLSGNVVQ